MYLHRLHIQRMKRVADLELRFTDAAGAHRPWTVIIGENGTAKTTILQAVALAAAGARQVNAVMDRGARFARDRRAGDAPLEITADFGFSAAGNATALHPHAPPAAGAARRLRSTVSLSARSTSFAAQAAYLGPDGPLDGPDPLVHARDVQEQRWFVAGYGVARALPDPAWAPDLDNRVIARLKPLFDSRANLASVGVTYAFARRDVEVGDRPGTRARAYSRVLNQILRAGGEALMPGVSGLELRGAGGAQTATDLIDADRFKMRTGRAEMVIAGVALSHGFQSTFAWISDLVGHILLDADAAVAPEEMEGLVLVDEIDLYLHPKWQASFVGALRRVFPRLQFIVTTHSPVVLAGLAPEEVVRLQADPETGDVRQVARDPESGALAPVSGMDAPRVAEADPRAMTGTEVYEDYFGIGRLTLHPQGEVYREYLTLSGDPLRTDEEDATVSALRDTLGRAGFTSVPAPVARART
ncbi:MAG: AAA family ATPase [Deltaproteobacteria bacterium]|nr:AAA family ATPase [Deltaproteobacteria bacterium]